MRILSGFTVLNLVLLTLSCSPIISVSYDYDRKADLAGLRTYDWIPIPAEMEEPAGLMIERIKKAVNVHLKTRGLRVMAESPDFLVAAHFGESDKLRVTSFGQPYASYRGYYYDGPHYWGGVHSYYYQEGKLVLDFINSESKKLIWRGTAKAFLGKEQTPEILDEIVNEAVERILLNFPPPAI